MDIQTYKINYEEIHWSLEYEGWIGIYQKRSPQEIITLHFASNASPQRLVAEAGTNLFGRNQRAVYRPSELPGKGEHEVEFLRGTHKKLIDGEWDSVGLMRVSQVHDDPLDNDPIYNTATAVEVI